MCRSEATALATLAAALAAALLVAAAPARAQADAAALRCTHSGNCVSSVDAEGLPPLRYNGNAVHGMAQLMATLRRFPEARVVHQDAQSVETIFTTFLGFRDSVEFRLDAAGQRIDFRSQSLLGRYDFGKNRSRMQAVSERFGQTTPD